MKQHGSALLPVVVLLSGLGALALAAAATAMTALAISGHQQMAQNAFEAAEAGIAHALLRAAATREAGIVQLAIRPQDPTAAATFHADTREALGAGSLPAGFSVGDNAGSFGAKHFFVTSDGASGRAARARLEQGFYLVVPDP